MKDNLTFSDASVNLMSNWGQLIQLQLITILAAEERKKNFPLTKFYYNLCIICFFFFTRLKSFLLISYFTFEMSYE